MPSLPPLSVSIPKEFFDRQIYSSPNRPVGNRKKRTRSIQTSDASNSSKFLVRYHEKRNDTSSAPSKVYSYLQNRAAPFSHEESENQEFEDTRIPPEYFHIETNFIKPAKYSGPGFHSTYDGKAWNTRVFPSLAPNSREEVLRLRSTLTRMLKDINSKKDNSIDATSMLDYTEKEWEVYSICFHELIRQVSTSCKEHGDLLREIQAHADGAIKRLLGYSHQLEQQNDNCLNDIRVLRSHNSKIENHYELMLAEAIQVDMVRPPSNSPTKQKAHSPSKSSKTRPPVEYSSRTTPTIPKTKPQKRPNGAVRGRKKLEPTSSEGKNSVQSPQSVQSNTNKESKTVSQSSSILQNESEKKDTNEIKGIENKISTPERRASSPTDATTEDRNEAEKCMNPSAVHSQQYSEIDHEKNPIETQNEAGASGNEGYLDIEPLSDEEEYELELQRDLEDDENDLDVEGDVEAAVVSLQSAFRGFRVRRQQQELEEIKRKDNAACKLQSIYRGHADRRFTQTKLAANRIIQQKRLQQSAISLIQKSIRFFLDRRALEMKQKSQYHKQRNLRGHAAAQLTKKSSFQDLQLLLNVNRQHLSSLGGRIEKLDQGMTSLLNTSNMLVSAAQKISHRAVSPTKGNGQISENDDGSSPTKSPSTVKMMAPIGRRSSISRDTNICMARGTSGAGAKNALNADEILTDAEKTWKSVELAHSRVIGLYNTEKSAKLKLEKTLNDMESDFEAVLLELHGYKKKDEIEAKRREEEQERLRKEKEEKQRIEREKQDREDDLNSMLDPSQALQSLLPLVGASRRWKKQAGITELRKHQNRKESSKKRSSSVSPTKLSPTRRSTALNDLKLSGGSPKKRRSASISNAKARSASILLSSQTPRSSPGRKRVSVRSKSPSKREPTSFGNELGNTTPLTNGTAIKLNNTIVEQYQSDGESEFSEEDDIFGDFQLTRKSTMILHEAQESILRDKMRQCTDLSRLTCRIHEDSKIQYQRCIKKITWLKRMIKGIYTHLVQRSEDMCSQYSTSMRCSAADLDLRFALSLSGKEWEFVSLYCLPKQYEMTLDICDGIYEYFQTQFGVRTLVDQAVYDFAMTTVEFSKTDDDVDFFSSFITEMRSLDGLAFYIYCRKLILQSSVARTPFFYMDEWTGMEIIDFAAIEVLGRFCFRLTDQERILSEDTFLYEKNQACHLPSQAYDQFISWVKLFHRKESQSVNSSKQRIQPVAPVDLMRKFSEVRGRSSTLNIRELNVVKPPVHLASKTSADSTKTWFPLIFVVDILYRIRMGQHLWYMRNEWIKQRFAHVDHNGDGFIDLDEFIKAFGCVYPAPNDRDLKLLFHNQVLVARTKEMSLHVFYHAIHELISSGFIQTIVFEQRAPINSGKNPISAWKCVDSNAVLVPDSEAEAEADSETDAHAHAHAHVSDEEPTCYVRRKTTITDTYAILSTAASKYNTPMEVQIASSDEESLERKQILTSQKTMIDLARRWSTKEKTFANMIDRLYHADSMDGKHRRIASELLEQRMILQKAFFHIKTTAREQIQATQHAMRAYKLILCLMMTHTDTESTPVPVSTSTSTSETKEEDELNDIECAWKFACSADFNDEDYGGGGLI